jgi:hypothetical protein
MHGSRSIVAGLVLTFGLASTAAAREPHDLAPASPQPDPPGLRPGLAVTYAYPHDVQWLSDAEGALRFGAEPGPPLVGFDYVDTAPGEKALTSARAEHVAARIEGYVRFDRAGVWQLAFHSNDGLAVTIGGARVYVHDGRHPCETKGWEKVRVPEPGWYRLEAIWFQRLSTSCLLAEWLPPDGEKGWIPNEVFAHDRR